MSDMVERQKTPAIVSLQNLEIKLNDEIRRHLSAQYDHNRNERGNQQEDQYSEDGHLELILAAMKRPPAFTTCRVNLIRATRKEVFDELQSLLSTTPQLEVLEDTGFPDVINIVPTENILSDDGSGGKKFKDGAFDKSFPSSLTGPDGDCEDDEKNSTVTNDLFSTWPSRREQGWSMIHRSIICDRFCGEAVLRGSDIFVMGVMAADTNIRAGEKVAVYADIPWKTNANSKGPRNGCVSDGKLIRGLKLEHYRGKCVYLGLGRAEYSRNEIFKKTKGVAITMSLDAKDRVGPPLPPLYGVLPDKMMLQNLPSVLVGHALNPKPNDVILDMCSAPGGKTSHLASLVRNEAVIVACDKSKKKVAAAKELFMRMGASCITPLALDATNCCAEKEREEGEDRKDSPKQEVKDVRQVRIYDDVCRFFLERIFTGPYMKFLRHECFCGIYMQTSNKKVFTNC
jgi:16S rRNA C967 or C1407 C5-methylase (RsmB/RsmF family)